MKKIEYMAPEMEVVELKAQVTLLAGSDGSNSSVTLPDEPSTEPDMD